MHATHVDSNVVEIAESVADVDSSSVIVVVAPPQVVPPGIAEARQQNTKPTSKVKIPNSKLNMKVNAQVKFKHSSSEFSKF